MPGQTANAESKKTFGNLTSHHSSKMKEHTAGQKIKNFFRINSASKNDLASEAGFGSGTSSRDDNRAPASQHLSANASSHKSGLRNSRFLPHIGRTRSTTVASEGNPLDDGMSPTAHANPYFQHQGPPALRHHDHGSIPPSPPDTPTNSKNQYSKAEDASAAAGKEELARKLRRVASAPNAQGLFSKGKGSGGSRPGTAELETPPKHNGLGAHSNSSALSMVESAPPHDNLLPVPGINGDITPGKLRNSIAFRRTYSSNSIKVKNVEVGPGSFDKIKLIGKGDVGKVYLVREKKSSRLYAMKGNVMIAGCEKRPKLTEH